LLYSGIILAVYLRLGFDEAQRHLVESHGFYKATLATAFCVISFYLHDLYDFMVMHNRRELVLLLIQALGLGWIALALLFYGVPQLMIGRGVSLISIPIILGLMLIWRVLIHYLMGHPHIGERVLIVGSGPMALETARAALAQRDAGIRIVGFTSNDPQMVGKSILNPKVIGLSSEIADLVRRENIDRIVVSMSERRGQFPTNELLHLSLAGKVHIEECPSFHERLTGRVSIDMLRPSWLIFSGRGRHTKISAFIRVMLHRTVALIGFVFSLPIMLVTAVLIKLESSGPILYKQERVGKNGRPFMVLKFRSMRTDAEKDGPQWASVDDGRVTRVGSIIRKIRVDELPQFWNILRGDMNFVGPRPERPHFVAQLAKEVPFYEQRHLIAPGLTGWAQIKYPYGASIEDARRKLEYDLYYIKNQSLFLDAVTLFETVKIVLLRRGSR